MALSLNWDGPLATVRSEFKKTAYHNESFVRKRGQTIRRQKIADIQWLLNLNTSSYSTYSLSPVSCPVSCPGFLPGFLSPVSALPPEGTKPEQRKFDVLIQGEIVHPNLDATKEAGGTRQMFMKEFRGVEAERDITIAFTPKIGQALISGVEVIEEAN